MEEKVKPMSADCTRAQFEKVACDILAPLTLKTDDYRTLFWRIVNAMLAANALRDEQEKQLAVAGAYEAAARYVAPPDIPLPTTAKPTIEELEILINSEHDSVRAPFDLLPDGSVVVRPDTTADGIRSLTPAAAQQALEAHVREHVDRVTKNLMDALKDAGTVRRIEWIIPADQAAVAERLEAVRKVRDAMLVYKCDHDEYDHCDTEAMIWADKLTAALGEGSK